jgi:hypothetical protein
VLDVTTASTYTSRPSPTSLTQSHLVVTRTSFASPTTTTDTVEVSLSPRILLYNLLILVLRYKGACQFPNKVATTIECDHTGDVAFVKFGCHHSSFKFQKQTKMTLLWSSDKRKGLLPQTIDGETTEVGDDLYVRCHAGQHKHQDQSSTQTDNYGQGSNDHGSQASGSGSGSIGKSGSIDGYGSISASGSIGGSISKENYNQGLPTIH